MNDNQYIIIQGPTTFHESIIETYKNVPNVIFSTLNDEPISQCQNLQKYFPLVITPLNFNKGTGNLNCQCKTSTNGLLMAHQKGATVALKIRSDMIISNVSKFMEILMGYHRLSFLAWHSDGYLIDYINYGPIHEMIKFWNIEVVNSYFAEKNLINNFFQQNNETDYTFENVKKHVTFFMEDLIKYNIDIKWLKYGISITEYYKHECYKYK